ncbi:hypothetical protein CC85DRAFT_329774 [Cutaneotrichosporon oleaginosum]|uniref:Uncharacterized protein n=1 Tax=Cutaneotrichosporon oleaginosum TaxID=879819 RepID=A0A0J0XHR1_9TREE|nr:uncharacterized protein CC85DRAFT_329774 [Cutaneotrichosporon oleaginosum]KLT40608.1 hypothetical protein CC85DRAFT_329774 [Cutaneotrichosporon oleaginosum]TXT03931.1 hypothetical protein COLE_07628 [Cutaneotrichosporon oleaginosum]
MPPTHRHFSGPPILPPVPELAFDILDGFTFQFDSLSTPPSAAFDASSPRVHSPLPIRLMSSRLIPQPPPNALADVPEDLSDTEEANEDMELSTTLPSYSESPSSLSRDGNGSSIPNGGPLRPTAPLNIRKKLSASPPGGLFALRMQHRTTLPDCPRTPSPGHDYCSVERLDPILAAIVNGDMREGGLPEELTLERTYPHYEKSYTASTKGSVHSRRPSEPDTGSRGALRDAFAEGTKAFVTTLNKRREEDRRRSVYSHKRNADSETWAPSEFDIPPPTTNAKAVSLLGHHDRRHDRRGSDADELQITPAPRPFPGATSKAAALLGIGVAEPPPVKRFGKFGSPKAPPNALHAIRRTQPTGWSGAGASATIKRMSQYAFQMMDDDIDLSDDLETPAPVHPIPHEEDVTIAPGPGQSFTPMSARLSVHGASPRGASPRGVSPLSSSPHSTGSAMRNTPSPLGSGHPFAAIPTRVTPQPRIRPEGTSPSSLSAKSSPLVPHTPLSAYSHSSGAASSSDSSRAPTALQRKSTLKARPPPISVERISPTRDFPLVEVPTPQTIPSSSTPTTARPVISQTEANEPPRFKSHILAKYRLIEPPIAVADQRDSTCTMSTTASGATGMSSNSGWSDNSDTYTSRESYAASARESVAASRHSLYTSASTESFGSHNAPRRSGASVARVDSLPSAAGRDDKSLTARLHKHVRTTSTASSASSAFSAVNSATATLKAAAFTLSGLAAHIAPGLTTPEHGKNPHEIPAHMRIFPAPDEAQVPQTQPKPPPWHNYKIRYDKDGREIPDLTPRPLLAAPVEESWFEPSTPVSPGADESALHRVGTLVRRGWRRK